jgi:hypothetical protein
MNGATPYLADVYASMQPAMSVAPPPAPAPPAMSVAPAPEPVMSQAPPEMPPVGPPLPPAPIGPPPPPPPAPDVNAQQAPPPDMLESTQPREFPLVQMGGGVIPEHEADLRGPTVKAAQGAYLGAENQAVGDITQRTQDQAQTEYDYGLQQEREARARQAGIERAQAEHQQELADLQADFSQSVQALSQAAVDPNRFWATRTSGQRTMALVGLALGGFGGGPNPAMEIIGQAIDRDINAQMQSYQLKKDVAQGKQTAFAMAMQKYQNEDAARAMARASALDVVAAQAAQVAALNKGTETANRADQMLTQIQQEKRAIAEQWVKFVPQQYAGPSFVNPKTGVTYNMNQARELEKELRGYGSKREEIGLTSMGKLAEEQVKGQIAQQTKKKENAVVLPTGEVFYAPTEKDAGSIRSLVESTESTRKLIAQAQAIRNAAAVGGVPLSPTQRGELQQIQSELITNFGVQHDLGALSKDDRDLSINGTADLFRLGPAADAQLKSLGERSTFKLHTKLKTYEGAPEKATGKMPGSFTAHGGKK